MKINYDINNYIFKNFSNPADWIEFQQTDFNHLPDIAYVDQIFSKEFPITDPKEVFEAIGDGTFSEEITEIRKTKDDEKRRKLKLKLPAIAFGGTFKDSRKKLLSASNLICIDFDHLDNLERLRFRLPFYSYIYGFFISPSGDGLKVLVRTNVESAEEYKAAAKLIIEEFKRNDFIADSSKQNISDLCFFSFDEKAYFNSRATIWRNTQYQTSLENDWSKDQIKNNVEYVIYQIEEKQLDITPSYDNWVRICFALIDQFGEDGRELFHKISQYNSEYDDSKCDKQYDYCIASAGTGITIRTFFQIAKEYNLKLSQKTTAPTVKLDPYDKEFYTGEDLLLRNINQLPTLLDPILPKVGLVALGGTSDVGKSTFLRHLAISISSVEESFLGFKFDASHNRAIYVSTEDDDLAMSYLIHKQNVSLKKPSSSFRNLMYVFDTYQLLSKLDKMIAKQPTDLVIIDTFTDLYSGEMNQTNKIRSFLHEFALLAKKHSCLVLMLHHTGKRTEDLVPSKNNLLGSVGFEGKMRLVLELRKDQDNPDLRHLCVVKSNYLSKEYKDASYVLNFDSNMLYSNTGARVPFEELAARKVDRAAEKEKWIEIAKPLIESGKTYQEVSEYLKEKGFFVSKSTIQREIPKN